MNIWGFRCMKNIGSNESEQKGILHKNVAHVKNLRLGKSCSGSLTLLLNVSYTSNPKTWARTEAEVWLVWNLDVMNHS